MWLSMMQEHHRPRPFDNFAALLLFPSRVKSIADDIYLLSLHELKKFSILSGCQLTPFIFFCILPCAWVKFALRMHRGSLL